MLAALVIGIALLVYGMRLVVTGIAGRGEVVTLHHLPDIDKHKDLEAEARIHMMRHLD